MAHGFAAKQLFSFNPEQSSEKLGDVYFSFVKGLMFVPVSIPGTTHYKCLQVPESLNQWFEIPLAPTTITNQDSDNYLNEESEEGNVHYSGNSQATDGFNAEVSRNTRLP